MRFRWASAASNDVLAAQLADELRLSRLFAQCLVNRGLLLPEPILRFIEPRLKYLADPLLLPGMDRAVERLWQCLRDKEPMVVFGDYDVDGVTAAAVLIETLRALGGEVQSYLPDRFEEGYGLSQTAVENCFERYGRRLVIAVDCGSTSAGSIEWLQGRGCDVVVLDHHQIGSPPPKPAAFVNPQLAGAGAPDYRELCSAGIALKLAHALIKQGRAKGHAAPLQFGLRELLDLVALGTIVDVVPLTGENRVF